MKQPIQKGWRLAMTLLTSIFLGLLSALFSATFEPPLYAHGGGTPRLTSAPVGPYRLYAWTDPEPWRVGQAHISLAVTKINPDTSSKQVEIPVTDVDITVTYTPMINNAVDPSTPPVVVHAVSQEFLGTFYYEADTSLTREGEWLITVAVNGAQGSGSKDFPMKTLPPRTLNWPLVGGAGALLVVILVLIAIWSRSQKPAQPVHRPHRGIRRVQRRSRTAERKEA